MVEHPDTVALRAVMTWLDERDRAYPPAQFWPLTKEDHAKANAALESILVVRDRLPADISRLWCQQLREVTAAPKEAEKPEPKHCCGGPDFGHERLGEPLDVCPGCKEWEAQRKREEAPHG